MPRQAEAFVHPQASRFPIDARSILRGGTSVAAHGRQESPLRSDPDLRNQAKVEVPGDRAVFPPDRKRSARLHRVPQLVQGGRPSTRARTVAHGSLLESGGGLIDTRGAGRDKVGAWSLTVTAQGVASRLFCFTAFGRAGIAGRRCSSGCLRSATCWRLRSVATWDPSLSRLGRRPRSRPGPTLSRRSWTLRGSSSPTLPETRSGAGSHWSWRSGEGRAPSWEWLRQGCSRATKGRPSPKSSGAITGQCESSCRWRVASSAHAGEDGCCSRTRA